jgi:DNA ligase-4
MEERQQKSEDLCNSIKFNDLCVLFEKIEKTAGSANKLRLLFNKEMKKFLTGQSIFPLLRLVLPLNDTERGNYGLKQASVAKTYVNALHLDQKTSDDARRLLNWKDPSKAHGVEMSKIVVGDFGLILEDILKSRVRADISTKTLGDVNDLLDSLANATNTEEKTNLIRNRILNEFSANEQKWIVRIIFRDMKIGLKHEQVLNSFYPNALKRYNECTNLKMVCEEEGSTSDLSGLQVGTKFSPMLAKGFSTSGGGQVATVESAMKVGSVQFTSIYVLINMLIIAQPLRDGHQARRRAYAVSCG